MAAYHLASCNLSTLVRHFLFDILQSTDVLSQHLWAASSSRQWMIRVARPLDEVLLFVLLSVLSSEAGAAELLNVDRRSDVSNAKGYYYVATVCVRR